jgi:5'-nucleotidase
MILVTNDDGPRALGLGSLIEVVSDIDAFEIVVPSRDRSGYGRAHKGSAQRRHSRHRVCGHQISTRDATPARLVLAELTVPRPSNLSFDLCIVGVNDGVNVGQDVTVSGTFCAALEAATLGCLGLAISAEEGFFTAEQRSTSASTLKLLRHFISAHLLSMRDKPCVININLPMNHQGGLELTRISRFTVFPAISEAASPGGIRIAHEVPSPSVVEKDSDIAAIFYRRAISVSVADYLPASVPMGGSGLAAAFPEQLTESSPGIQRPQ